MWIKINKIDFEKSMDSTLKDLEILGFSWNLIISNNTLSIELYAKDGLILPRLIIDIYTNGRKRECISFSTYIRRNYSTNEYEIHTRDLYNLTEKIGKFKSEGFKIFEKFLDEIRIRLKTD